MEQLHYLYNDWLMTLHKLAIKDNKMCNNQYNYQIVKP